MTIQRKEISAVQLDRLRKPKPVKKPKLKEGFPESVKEVIQARSGGVCELDSCGPAQVHHHRRPRGKGGTSLAWVNRTANALHLSSECHDRAEGKLPDSSRHMSYVNGWLVSMLGSAVSADVPVLYRGRWVLLRDDGSVKEIVTGWDTPEVLS